MSRMGTASRAKGALAVPLTIRRIAIGLTLLAALAACREPEVILPGERIDVVTGEPVQATIEPRQVSFQAPAQRANADWTHRAGNPAHDLVNPALGAVSARLWSVAIGQGDTRRQRLSAQPVVAGGRIFTLDSQARISAVSTSGTVLWSVDASPTRDRADEASGGGLAYGEGRLFVTLGFGEIVALDPATGGEIWRQDLGSVATSAPTVEGGRVFVSGRDGVGWALDASTGRVLWTVTSTPDRLGVMGGAAPAVSGDTVVFPFISGELIAAETATGAVRWTAYLLGERPGASYAKVADITGDPVISGGRVFVGNHSGETAAIELGTGQTLWTAAKGALGPVTVAGGSVFLVSDQNDLVRLEAANGAVVWSVPLPYFVNPRPARRETIFAHYGPLLAGGRLIVPSSDGLIRVFNPADGALVGTIDLPSGAAAEPLVAGGTLYVLANDGTLNAFR
jgi:outer membrane protein assembly factor BamB